MGIEIRGGDTFKSTLQKIAETHPVIMDQALDDTADAISLEAQQTVPADTGRLRASINVKREVLKKSIGTNVEYAQPVEYGTPYREGTRFLTNAYEKHRRRVAEFFKENGVKNV